MRPLSATECISPAVERTKLMLFTPFRIGRTWKLCITAYLCRIGTLFFPFPLIYLAFLPAVRSAGGTLGVTLLCITVLLLTALFVYVFHLCSRLQFAYFDMVLNRGEFVAPAWRKYGPQSLSWTGLKILIGSALTLICAAPTVAYVRHVIPVFRSLPAMTPGQPPPPQLMAAIVSLYVGYFAILLIFGFFFLISSLLSDFIVPSLALEDTGIKEAFRRMSVLIRNEPGEFALYTLIKTVLGVVAYMCAIIAWEIAFTLCTLILAGIAGLIGYLLHLAGIPSMILIVLAIALGILWYGFSLYTTMFPIGVVLTFLDAYALYFLGGRYPMLGGLLDRSTPPPSNAYVAAFPLYRPPYYPAPPAPLSPTDGGSL